MTSVYYNTAESTTYRQNGILYVNNNAPSGTVSLSRFPDNFKSGVRDSDWRQKVAKRIDASHPYENRVTTCEQIPFYCKIKRKSDNAYVARHQYFAPTVVIRSAMPSRPVEDDRALGQLKGRLAKDLKVFQSLIPLGEVKETRSLIKSTANITEECIKTLISLKQMKLGKTSKQLRDIAARASDVWLQFNFGIAPTVRDINTGLKVISSYMLDKNNFSAVHSGKAEVDWVGTVTNTLTTAEAADGYQWTCIREQYKAHYKVKYVAGVFYDVETANDYNQLHDRFGLNFGAMIPALWELTPYSWVADYFGTIGQFLDDVFVSNGGTTIFVTKSRVFDYECTQSWRLDSIGNNFLIEASEGREQKYNYHHMTRELLTSLPRRSLRLRSVDEIGQNAVSKLLNLSAILLKGNNSRVHL